MANQLLQSFNHYEQSMACLQEKLRVNIRQNLQVDIQIATKYSDILGPVKLIEMFESRKTFEGAFLGCPPQSILT